MSSVTTTFSNGTTADATEVNQNFSDLVNEFDITAGHYHDGVDSRSLAITTTGKGGTGQDFSATAQGSIPYFSAAGVVSVLAPSTSGYYLKTQGAAANPAWAILAAVGAVTKIVAASDSIDSTRGDYECDGTADDVQIQTAIDACTSGGTVVLLEGTYNISATITMADNVRLVGCGWGTVLKAIVNLNDEIITGATTVDGFSIENMKIDSATNAQATQISAVHLADCDDFVVRNCWIYFDQDGGETGLRVDGGTRGQIKDNLLQLVSGGSGDQLGMLRMEGTYTYIKVIGNHFDATACSTNASSCIGGTSTDGFTRCIIANNTMLGDAAEMDYGIYLPNNADYSENIITGNVIEAMGTDGIHIAGSNCIENIVDGNQTMDGYTDNGTGTISGDNNVAA